jgi:hypothetical protein
MQKMRLWFDHLSNRWRAGFGVRDGQWLTECVECGVQQLTKVNRPCRCPICKINNKREVAALRAPAHAAVVAAMEAGILPRLVGGNIRCVDCGGLAKVYDHRAYAKPLEVVPVCQSCNFKRGPAKELLPYVRKRWNVDYYRQARRSRRR